MIELTKLFRSAAEGSLPHACFLSSADNSAAEALARQLAARFCGLSTPEALRDCPDYFEPELPLRAEALRSLLDELMKAPFQSRGHAVLLRKAHQLDVKLQNILLKTLEEPPRDTLFLLCGNSAAMLPTVLSRCALLPMGIERRDETKNALLSLGAGAEEAALYSAMGGGSRERLRRLDNEGNLPV